MRVRRSILNFASTALLMTVTMLVAFPAARWLLFWLGEPAQGGIQVVNKTMGFMTLLELGLGGAIGPLLAGAMNRNDYRALHETVAASARAYAWVAVASIAIGLLLTPLIPWFAPDFKPAQLADLKRAWMVQLVGFVPLIFVPLRSIFEARQLGYVVNLLLLGQSLLVTAISLVLAWAGWGITGQAIALVAGTWAFSLTISTGAFRSHPGLLHSMLTLPTTLETRRSLKNLSLPTLLLNISGRLSVLSDELIISRMLGVSRIPSFTYTQKLAQMGQMILQSIGGASWAALAQLHAQGDLETLNRRLVEMTRLIVILGIVGLVPVVAYNRVFFRLWLAPLIDYGGDVVIVLAAVNAVLLATQSLWAWCFVATGKIRQLVPVSIAMMVVNLLASVLATHVSGLPGPLIGSTFSFVSLGLWMPLVLLRRNFGTPIGALVQAIAVPSGLGVVAAGLLRAFTRFHEPAGWLALAGEMSLSALVMLGLSLALLLTKEDRALWRLRLAQLWPSRPVAVVAEGSESLR